MIAPDRGRNSAPQDNGSRKRSIKSTTFEEAAACERACPEIYLFCGITIVQSFLPSLARGSRFIFVACVRSFTRRVIEASRAARLVPQLPHAGRAARQAAKNSDRGKKSIPSCALCASASASGTVMVRPTGRRDRRGRCFHPACGRARDWRFANIRVRRGAREKGQVVRISAGSGYARRANGTRIAFSAQIALDHHGRPGVREGRIRGTRGYHNSLPLGSKGWDRARPMQWMRHAMGQSKAAPVGSFAPNNFGLYDMVGNVWQWTQDCWHPNYNSAPTDGSSWVETACLNRVVRGGSYVSLPSYVESAGRFGYPSDVRFDSIGFRVARTLIP